MAKQPTPIPAASSGSKRRPTRQKLLDAGSASGLIAYFSGLNLTPSVKGLLLLSSPWIAIVLTTVAALLALFGRGFSEIYLHRRLNRELLRLSKEVLVSDTATDAQKAEATADVNEIEGAELRIRREMRTRFDETFSMSPKP